MTVLVKTTSDDNNVLVMLGQRLAGRRIAKDLTQAELAREAGIGTSTVERMEAGRSTQVVNLVRVCRVLGLLDDLLGAIPEPGLRPMDLLALKAKSRRRVRNEPDNEERPPWRWEDEQ